MFSPTPAPEQLATSTARRLQVQLCFGLVIFVWWWWSVWGELTCSTYWFCVSFFLPSLHVIGLFNQRVPAKWVLNPPSAHAWDPASIQTVLQFLRPDNMIALYSSWIFRGSALPLSDPHYGSTYAMVNASTITADLPPPGRFQFPTPNPYLPTSLALVPAPAPSSSSPSSPIHAADAAAQQPTLVADQPSAVLRQVWWLQDTTFRVPRVSINVALTSHAFINMNATAMVRCT